MLFVKKFAYGVPTPTIPWVEQQVLPDFDGDGHLFEGDKPQRGDIVVFRYPHDPKIHYVKRCVATGGDIVALRNKQLLLLHKEGDEFVTKNYPKENIVQIQGRLWVIDPYRAKHPGIHNDKSITEENSQFFQLFDFMPIRVPEGEYFMMGDNRDHSNDSRFWGTVPYKYIVGTPWFLYFSWDENKKIRWKRVFRTVESLEKDINTEQIDTTTHEKGIY
jgi:signal peptidase I